MDKRMEHDMSEAYNQGQRDREQGWPEIDWGFTGTTLLAYRAGYKNPRV